ncbi:MAG: SIR2 family protein [Cellulomonadaceae bacterium]|nr:SIR2 family protein [Cellulomonadaceae bacterium]
MNSKNLAFLFGSGCSSAKNEKGEELGIPTMAPMAHAFLQGEVPGHGISSETRNHLHSALGIDVDDARYASNLEALMEVLYGFAFALSQSAKQELVAARDAVSEAIAAVKKYVLHACLEGQDGDPGRTVLRTYERFYRRLAQRDRALPRPWVFTTNYDLFHETAMDRLGIPYINGFQGSVERRFNPSVFRYTLAEQLDISSRRWSSVDSLVYFAKLHGSLSWASSEEGLFPVVERAPREDDEADRLLIYPTPAKQNASFASPYSDMFREFQRRVAREQSALITLGYSFSDEHVNNIIFQALTIPTFRLVAFVDPNANAMVQRLREMDDPRIWIIGTEDADASWKGHFFDPFVDDIMPSDRDDPTDKAIERVLQQLVRRTEPVPAASLGILEGAQGEVGEA